MLLNMENTTTSVRTAEATFGAYLGKTGPFILTSRHTAYDAQFDHIMATGQSDPKQM